jgi:hypothetical protein
MLADCRPGSNLGGANNICVECPSSERGCHLIKPEDLFQGPLRLLHEAGFQADGHGVHLAINLMVTIHQADGFGLRTAFEHLVAAAQFQILDQDNAITVREYVAVGVLHDAWRIRCVRPGFARLFMTTGGAFPFVREFQNFGHLAHRAG